MKQVTEIYCHGCRGYVKFAIDRSCNGDYAVKCPKCGHEHHRSVKGGRIEDNGARSNYAPAFDYPCYLDAVWNAEPVAQYQGNSSPDLWESWLMHGPTKH